MVRVNQWTDSIRSGHRCVEGVRAATIPDDALVNLPLARHPVQDRVKAVRASDRADRELYRLRDLEHRECLIRVTTEERPNQVLPRRRSFALVKLAP
jgi:hypothetical protein